MSVDVFLKPKSMGNRDWGSEELIGLVENCFSFKRLYLKAGSKGGLQYHHKKHEIGILISGELIIRLAEGKKLREYKLNAGSAFEFKPGVVHQEEAVTDCVIIEASTPYKNDRVRVEGQYGLDSDNGLPSTNRDEVLQITKDDLS